MEKNFSSEVLPTAKTAASTIRETLLKVCRHYQDPDLGATYANVAHYYEKQIKAIPQPPPLQTPSTKQQTSTSRSRS